MRCIPSPLVCVLALIAVMGPAAASAADPAQGAITHQVLPGWQQADGTRMAGLAITLAPGWKTYWRSPGDAGIPPQFDWGDARNVADVHVHWPAPQVFWQSGMRSVGYTDTVVLPITVTPKRPGKDMRLKGRIDVGICSDICVPYSFAVDARIDAADSGSRTPAIAAALTALPYSADEAGVQAATCDFRPTEDGLAIEARITMPSAGAAEEAVIEPPRPGIWVSDAKTSRSGGALTVRAEMIGPGGAPLTIDRSAIRITVLGSRHAVDISGCTGS